MTLVIVQTPGRFPISPTENRYRYVFRWAMTIRETAGQWCLIICHRVSKFVISPLYLFIRNGCSGCTDQTTSNQYHEEHLRTIRRDSFLCKSDIQPVCCLFACHSLSLPESVGLARNHRI